MPDQEGTIDNILKQMPVELKSLIQKICNIKLPDSFINSGELNMQDNEIKDLIKKIQKVISKHKNVIFSVKAPQYTFKNEEGMSKNIWLR